MSLVFIWFLVGALWATARTIGQDKELSIQLNFKGRFDQKKAIQVYFLDPHSYVDGQWEHWSFWRRHKLIDPRAPGQFSCRLPEQRQNLNLSHTLTPSKGLQTTIPFREQLVIIVKAEHVYMPPRLITLKPEGVTDVVLTLLRRPRIYGRVIDESSGSPLTNWEIHIAVGSHFLSRVTLPEGRTNDFYTSSQILRTNRDGYFTGYFPFSSEVAIWNEDNLDYRCNFQHWQLK